MIFHEKRLLTDNSQEILYLIFFGNLENLPFAAVVVGTLRVNGEIRKQAIEHHPYLGILISVHLYIKE